MQVDDTILLAFSPYILYNGIQKERARLVRKEVKTMKNEKMYTLEEIRKIARESAKNGKVHETAFAILFDDALETLERENAGK